MAKLKEGDARALEAFLEALGQFTAIDPNMPVQQIRAFVFVALHEHENLGTMDLAQRSGINNTVLSRYLSDLGDTTNRYGDSGAGLVYQEMDVKDKRTRKAYLTEKGQTKKHELVRAMHH